MAGSDARNRALPNPRPTASSQRGNPDVGKMVQQYANEVPYHFVTDGSEIFNCLSVRSRHNGKTAIIQE